MTEEQASSSSRFRPVWMLWLVAPLLLWWAARDVRWSDVARRLAHLSPREIVILIGLNVLVMLTFSGRWWIILQAMGHRIPYLDLARYRMVAFAVSFFTPGSHFGGEPLQVLLVSRHHQVTLPEATASVVLDKLIEVIVNLTFLVTGVVLTLHTRVLQGTVQPSIMILFLGLLLVPVGYVTALWQGRRPVRWLAGATRRSAIWPWLHSIQEAIIVAEEQAADFVREHPKAILWALMVSVLSWAGLLFEYWLAYHYLGLTLDALGLISLLTAARIALLLPLPGGLGSFEASQTWMLVMLGFDPVVGLGLSILSRIRDLAFGGLGLWWGLDDFGAKRVFQLWTAEPDQDKV